MGLRRAYFRWLIPSAFVLPLWLLIGWIVTGSSPWGLLWVLVSAPIVLVGQLILSLLVRARGTVRTDRAVSWTDVGLMGAWHALIIALGFFDARWWWPIFGLTVAVGVATLWVSFVQLWREARGGLQVMHTPSGAAYIPPQRDERRQAEPDVFIVTEQGEAPRR